MNTYRKHIAAMLFATSFCAATARTLPIFTQMDRELFSVSSTFDRTVPEYMKRHNLSADEMFNRLEENISEHLENLDKNAVGRLDAASSTVKAMAFVHPSEWKPYIAKYAGIEYPKDLRVEAISAYIVNVKNNAFEFAKNILLEPYRTPSEHNCLRMALMQSAVSAAPADREKYVDFLKWAVMHMEGSTSFTTDKNLLDLDPTWRTNSLRKINAERILALGTTDYGTNLLLNLIRDYELVAGIRQPEPMSVSAQVSQTNVKAVTITNVTTQINANTEAVATAVSINFDALSSVENNTSPSTSIALKRLWVFAAPVILAALAVVTFLRRKICKIGMNNQRERMK